MSKKKGHQKNLEEMSRKHEFGHAKLHKNPPKQEILKSSPPPPPISKSQRYADHPPNAGHGFAALITYTYNTLT